MIRMDQLNILHPEFCSFSFFSAYCRRDIQQLAFDNFIKFFGAGIQVLVFDTFQIFFVPAKQFLEPKPATWGVN